MHSFLLLTHSQGVPHFFTARRATKVEVIPCFAQTAVRVRCSARIFSMQPKGKTVHYCTIMCFIILLGNPPGTRSLPRRVKSHRARPDSRLSQLLPTSTDATLSAGIGRSSDQLAQILNPVEIRAGSLDRNY